MQLGFVATGEETGGFQYNIDAQIFPRQVARVAFLQDLNLVATHDNVLIVVTDLAVEFAMHRVPLEQMRERMRVGEIVDRADFLNVFLRHSPQNIQPWVFGVRRWTSSRIGRARNSIVIPSGSEGPHLG